MGCYLNPKNHQDKQEFLEEKGEKVDILTEWKDIPEGKMAVCLILNMHPPFATAAAVAYCEREFEELTRDFTDQRPKRLFFVPIEDVKNNSNLSQYVKD